MPNIQIIDTDGRISNFPINKDVIVIGRSEENDLVLPDKSVSRNHARIAKQKKGYILTDLGSFNGTKVSGKSIQSILLKNNDQIRIGKILLKFSTGEKPVQSPVQTVVLTKESDYEKGHSTIIESTAEDSSGLDSQDLLISTGIGKSPAESVLSLPAEEVRPPAEVKEELLSLERMNKVLFVLYEVSRQLHLIHDFNELLKKIMDLIFVVIDADYGFVILTSDEEEDELTPVVVKYKDDKAKGKAEIKASRTIINKVVNDKVALLTTDAMADTRLEHAQSLFSQKIRSAMCVPLWKKDEVIGVIQLDSVRFNNQFTEEDLELLKAIGHQMAMVIEQASLNEQIREEERMIGRLERYHSPQIIEMILRGSQETKENIMEPKDLTATVFFTDIVGFTPLSEKMPPREINLLLNQFFSRMTDIIFKYDGTLDKYIGDCIMAVFGAPIEKKDDAERAIQAALEMKRELKAIMKETGPERKFDIRIGINTGRVVAGNIGSPNRMEYTVIGDPVNIASRLESIAQPNQILIGEETYKRVKRKFKIKKVGPKKVKGRATEVMVYEVLG
jgi:adenylate cyclase